MSPPSVAGDAANRAFAVGAASRAFRSATSRWSSRSAAPASRSLADRGGVVDTRIPVALTPGWHEARLHTEGSAVAEAPIRIVGPDVDFGIISDVDDTVMVTALPRPLLAFWNTFVLDEHARIPTPGMAVLFERLATRAPGLAGHLPLHGRVERRADAHPIPLAQPLPRRSAAAHRLGPHARPVVPQRPRAQGAEPPPAGRRVPRSALAAHRRRRAARRGAVRALRRRAPRPGRRGGDPSTVDRRGGARRRAHEGRTARCRRGRGCQQATARGSPISSPRSRCSDAAGAAALG